MSFRLGFLGAAAIFFLASCNPLNASTGPGGGNLDANALFPCEVGAVLQQHCWRCHGQVPQAAPMSLYTWADTHQTITDSRSPQVDGSQTPVYERIEERIHASTNKMPQGDSLTDQEMATLDNWINAGAPSGTGCGQPGSGGSDTSGNGGSGNTGAGDNTGAAGAVSYGGTTNYGGSPGTGGVAATDAGGPPPDQCNPFELRANNGTTTAGFPVPAGTRELYQCFSFHVDLSKGNQGLSFKNLPSHADHPVIHHWLLYAMTHAETDHTSSPCLGAHADGALMAGWAPGNGDSIMPKDVGLDLGTGDFILEVHFNNYGADTVDDSGVEVCAAKQPRANTASISWLGNDLFSVSGAGKWKVSGTCTPTSQQPIHVFEVWPHMHHRGVSMDATIKRSGGAVENFYSYPFDFNTQRQWSVVQTINPGDVIETNCHYQSTDSFGFGEATTDEMCFGFTVAYPAHQLVQPGPNSIIHADECVVTEPPVSEPNFVPPTGPTPAP